MAVESPGQHLSDLELELARTGEADADVGSHISGCPTCAESATMLSELAEALRQDSPSVQVPDLVEARILRQARRAAGLRPRARRPRWAAVAAAAVLLSALTWILRSPLRSPFLISERADHTHLNDLDGDGVTDILDAYKLAMRIATGGTVDATWDIDNNGQIDRRDVDSLAMSIVRSDPEIRR